MATVEDIKTPFLDLSEKDKLELVLRRREARRNAATKRKKEPKATVAKTLGKTKIPKQPSFDSLSPEELKKILQEIGAI